jgi:hypothetical protein
VHGVRGCAAGGRAGPRRAPRDRAHPDALGAHGGGQRLRRLTGRAGPRPRTRPLHHDLHLPRRMSHRRQVSAPRDTPTHGDLARAGARVRRRRTLFAYLIGVSPRLEFTTLTCGPNTRTRRLDQNARICTVPGLPGLDREAAQNGGYLKPSLSTPRLTRTSAA